MKYKQFTPWTLTKFQTKKIIFLKFLQENVNEPTTWCKFKKKSRISKFYLASLILCHYSKAMGCTFLGQRKNSCSFSLHKFLHQIFWTQFKNVQLRGPYSSRPCISRPYCTFIIELRLQKLQKLQNSFLFSRSFNFTINTIITNTTIWRRSSPPTNFS